MEPLVRAIVVVAADHIAVADLLAVAVQLVVVLLFVVLLVLQSRREFGVSGGFAAVVAGGSCSGSGGAAIAAAVYTLGMSDVVTPLGLVRWRSHHSLGGLWKVVRVSSIPLVGRVVRKRNTPKSDENHKDGGREVGKGGSCGNNRGCNGSGGGGGGGGDCGEELREEEKESEGLLNLPSNTHVRRQQLRALVCSVAGDPWIGRSLS